MVLARQTPPVVRVSDQRKRNDCKALVRAKLTSTVPLTNERPLHLSGLIHDVARVLGLALLAKRCGA